MTLVSVIIPTYNRSDLLPRAIDSVLKQTVDDFELIIVDDCSEDNTSEVVKRYNDKKIKFISHSKNQGGSAARNTGIKHADGDYIAFLDSDDEWMPRKLEFQVKCLESRSDEWAAVYCGTRGVRHGKTKTIRKIIGNVIGENPNSVHGKEGGEEVIVDILMTNLKHGGASTIMAKSDIVREINGFDESFQRQQDWEFLIRLLKVKKMAYVDQNLVITHETGYPSSDSLKESKSKLFGKFKGDIKYAESAGYPVRDAHLFELSRVYLRENNFRKGIGHLPSKTLSFRQYLQLSREIIEGLMQKL
ncbi:glycosyltransferase [Halococcus dombrowskii]|uniref:Glycosyltransferase n=1 Tax=Halococcus dombrowskii TaxID=179637 RepID=A0AAV3SD81_HALDO|nr:glycosyltransferase family 2 protein [Halococcus dombrowskii]UOO95168.1 glycosyltransferase [Halococcus dombrowskii]